jgi:hypothetical protein
MTRSDSTFQNQNIKTRFVNLFFLSRIFYDKKIAQEVPGDSLGDEWKGYIFRITGGNDKQGFPMKQGVLVPYRVRLLLQTVNPATASVAPVNVAASPSVVASLAPILLSCPWSLSSKANRIFRD